MTFFLMVVIGFALFLKIIIGAMYTIGYRCSHGTTNKAIIKGIDGAMVKSESKV
jgi:hypothetical protein